MRCLGVDPGGRRMGLAFGDQATGVVSPLEIVAYRGVENAAKHIAATAAELGAARVVLGLPARANGSLGDAGRRSHRLAEALEALGISIDFQSEYLSTNEARRRARASGRPSSKPVDDIAAQVLLEEYLAGLGSGTHGEP